MSKIGCESLPTLASGETPARTPEKTHFLAWRLLPFGGAFILLLGMPTLADMWDLWISHENYHGLVLVPILTGFVLLKRVRKAVCPILSPWRGLGYVIPPVLAVMLTADLAGQVRLAGIFFVISLGLLGFSCLGKDAKNIVLGPLLFLLLMIPPPDNIINTVTLALQQIMAFLVDGVYLLFSENYAGRDQFAFWFDPGSKAMTIAPECSGIRSLLGMIIMASFFIVLKRYKSWKAVVMIGAAAAIALSLNLARIIATMELRLRGYEHYSRGPWHGYLGIAIFLVGLIALGHLSQILNKPVAEPQEMTG